MAKISKRDKQTDHLPLAWPANFDNSPSPMPCAKMYARPREDPAIEAAGVDLIATICGGDPPALMEERIRDSNQRRQAAW